MNSCSRSLQAQTSIFHVPEMSRSMAFRGLPSFNVSRARASTSFQPRLERLEDRTLLSAGDLDPTFGVGGKLTTSFQQQVDSSAQALALQPDGKIIMTGAPTIATAQGWFVARYEPDGSPDPSFGSGGRVSNTFTGRA